MLVAREAGTVTWALPTLDAATTGAPCCVSWLWLEPHTLAVEPVVITLQGVCTDELLCLEHIASEGAKLAVHQQRLVRSEPATANSTRPVVLEALRIA